MVAESMWLVMHLLMVASSSHLLNAIVHKDIKKFGKASALELLDQSTDVSLVKHWALCRVARYALHLMPSVRPAALPIDAWLFRFQGGVCLTSLHGPSALMWQFAIVV